MKYIDANSQYFKVITEVVFSKYLVADLFSPPLCATLVNKYLLMIH